MENEQKEENAAVPADSVTPEIILPEVQPPQVILCGKCNKPKAEKPNDESNDKFCQCGRPWFNGKDEKDILAKLEESARIDATVKMSCLYADISVDSYYRYINSHEEFHNRLDLLHERMPLKAQQNVMAAIESGDLALSKWMMEKKNKDFMPTLKVEHTGNIQGETQSELEELSDEFNRRGKELIKKSWQNENSK